VPSSSADAVEFCQLLRMSPHLCFKGCQLIRRCRQRRFFVYLAFTPEILDYSSFINRNVPTTTSIKKARYSQSHRNNEKNVFFWEAKQTPKMVYYRNVRICDQFDEKRDNFFYRHDSLTSFFEQYLFDTHIAKIVVFIIC
jgi:hypothetical protein